MKPICRNNSKKQATSYCNPAAGKALRQGRCFAGRGRRWGGGGFPSLTRKSLSHDEYTVAWVCPLEVELIAALEMLDEEHERLPQQPADHNVYTLGSVAGHNLVIASIPIPGNNPAATVVTQLRMTFPNIRFRLLVGIGGGVPVTTDNAMIRLGDIVVSKPTEVYSGFVQYDHGKACNGLFQRTGILPPPPAVLLQAAGFGCKESMLKGRLYYTEH